MGYDIYSQAVVWDLPAPGDVEVLHSQQLVELETHGSRTPGVRQGHDESRVAIWSGGREGKYHPVSGVGILQARKEGGDLRLRVSVGERLVGTVRWAY